MRIPSRLVLMIVLAVSALAVGAYVWRTPGLKPVVIAFSGPPAVYAEQRVRDVGAVETDSKVNTEFLLYNKGGQHLRITDVETTCGCTLTEMSKDVIAPGDFTRITVDLDTSIKIGPVRKKITVHSNDPERPQLDLFLVGEVKPRQMEGHEMLGIQADNPLVLFQGECATCHVQVGVGKTGKALFQADCGMCHGLNAQGHGSAGPSLLRGDWQDEAYRRRMRRIIAEGSPNSPQMPPFSKHKGGPLSDDDIDSLVTFLKTQNLQYRMGLLEEPDDLSAQDDLAFQEALRQPH